MGLPAHVVWIGAVLSPYLCSMSFAPLIPTAEETYFLGVFGAGMVRAAAAGHPIGQEPGHWSRPDSTTAVWGQAVYVRAVGGHRAEVLESGMVGGAMARGIVVLWDYDAGCEPTRFGRGEPWGIPGEAAFIPASMRDEAEWVDGLPTFDVYWGGERIYPFSATKHGRAMAEYARETWGEREGRNPAAAPPRLTPEEAFKLIHALPTACDYVTDPDASASQLSGILRAWGTTAEYFPANDVFRRHRAWRDGEDRSWQRRC